jgi:acetyl/propionyl-CoA carboxylase alpha subunit
VHAVASALWQQAQRHAHAPVLRGLPSGWRNNPTQMQQIAFVSRDSTLQVAYRVNGRDHIAVALDGALHEATVLSWDAEHIAMVLDGVHRTCQIITREGIHHVHSTLGTSELHEVPRFPPPAREEVRGGCRAPMPGKILAVRVEPGQAVRKGETLVILEAMKMEHEVVAPHDGTVQEVLVETGQQVDAGAVLVVLDEEQSNVKPEMASVK